MIKYNIYFQDLKEDAQNELWGLVSKSLLDMELIEERHEDESKDEFLDRLREETDHYINTHNFAVPYCI